MRSVIAAVVLLVLAGCKAQRAEVVDDAQADPMAGMGPGECVGCQKRPEGVIPATAYRFDVQVWEMPLEHAEKLYRRTDEIASSLALLIDVRGLEKPLRELAAHDDRVRLLERPQFGAAAGKRALLPARTGAKERLWSDGLRLELGGNPTPGWAPNALDFACSWTSPQGEALGRAQGVTPLPHDHAVALWCLPARVLAEQPEPRTARAIVALVRVTPIT